MKYGIYVVIMLLLVSSVAAQTGATTYARVIVEEGATKQFLTVDKEFNLKVLTITDTKEEVTFQLNGEISKSLKEREKHTFSDGSIVVVSDVLVNEGADGPDLVQFYFVGGRGSRSTRQDPVDGAEYDLTRLAEDVSKYSSQPRIAALDRVAQVECIKSSNCNDKNPCTVDRCMSGECVYASLTGCPIGDVCVPHQEVVTVGGNQRKFCSLSGKMISQKEDGSACESSFECANKCIDGLCASEMQIYVPDEPEPAVQQVTSWLDWFLGIFGL